MIVEEEALLFTVTDLKQFAYCRRVVFYTYCLPLVRPVTFKMERGVTAHQSASTKERRRSLRAYGLHRGERHFNVPLESPRLGLSGRVDMVIQTDENQTGANELIPVEYKNSRRAVGRHWKEQLAAYALMLEETWKTPVRRGFVYRLPLRKAQEIAITPRLRKSVLETIAQMRAMVERQAMPPPPKSRRPCVECEFRRFCNDVL
ncbi:MAG: CRISPR-associated protein Cas4 [Caldilineae bacterium]|nr:MAG: CRISPR-associated protein Cas4 [Caldilineae bacterium]